MDEKEYIASLEQGTRLLMEQNSNSRSAFKELQALHEAVVNSSAWKLTWPVRYIREKLHKPFFFTEFPDMQHYGKSSAGFASKAFGGRTGFSRGKRASCAAGVT